MSAVNYTEKASKIRHALGCLCYWRERSILVLTYQVCGLNNAIKFMWLLPIDSLTPGIWLVYLRKHPLTLAHTICFLSFITEQFCGPGWTQALQSSGTVEIQTSGLISSTPFLFEVLAFVSLSPSSPLHNWIQSGHECGILKYNLLPTHLFPSFLKCYFIG